MSNIEEKQRKIELAENKYKQSLYQGSLNPLRVFPAFSTDHK
jgi:hypothetical protein